MLDELLLITTGDKIYQYIPPSRLTEFTRLDELGIEKPGDTVYGQPGSFNYVFIQYCDKLLLQARYLYRLTRFGVPVCVSSARVSRIFFGWAELQSNDNGVTKFQLDLTKDELVPVEIYHEDTLCRKITEVDPNQKIRAEKFFLNYIS